MTFFKKCMNNHETMNIKLESSAAY